ncbi:MAG: DUF924 family protein [Sphingomonadaceae bacterium]
MTNAADVVSFWRKAGPERWFARTDTAFDTDFRNGFLDIHMAAARRELDHWRQTPESALALLILLDQYPRNSFRGTAHMYATDALALCIARETVACGFDQQIEPALRLFVYLPWEHSENLADQRRAVELITPLGGEPLSHALTHLDVIERFGRFPHRNPMFGRETTPEEAAYLAAGGFSG